MSQFGSRERRRTQQHADDHSGKLTDHPISEKGTFRDLARIMHWQDNNGFSRDPINFQSHPAPDAHNQSVRQKNFSFFFDKEMKGTANRPQGKTIFP
ncbi:MAG: hypothetical protein CBE43_02955 [Rhodopirellula sp. TMED283]|nr:MAG: hypothetical protein CBE43_02955 [Rhodopirellula sp. TMED283]